MSERLDYVQQLETQIAAAKGHLETLQSEQKEARAEAQHEEVANLEKYLDEANVNLNDLKAASEDAWQSLKTDMDRLLKSIRETVSKLLIK